MLLASAPLAFFSRTHRQILHSVFVAVCALVTVSVLYTVTVGQAFWDTIPELHLQALEEEQSIRIMDRLGNELYHMYADRDQVNVELDAIPPLVRQAFISIEDERFFTRSCFDARAIARAAYSTWILGDIQGGSTITQQLIRNAFLTPEKTLTRKLKELVLACQLEEKLSKEEILTHYLNTVPLGGPVYGVRQAAKRYFGLPIEKISLAQAAVLAALPQRPSYFDPYGSHRFVGLPQGKWEDLMTGTGTVKSIRSDISPGLIGRMVLQRDGTILRVPGRSDSVLAAMQRLGYITEADRLDAQKRLDTITFAPPQNIPDPSHFVMLIRKKTAQLIAQSEQADSWKKAGLTVRTTLDPRLQRIAEQTLADRFPALSEASGARDAAMVVLDRETREVLAYVGNVSWGGNTGSMFVDMAQRPRQPGSSFKPLVYATLLGQGLYTSESIIEDTPLHIGAITPKNFEGGFLGRIPIKKALATSRNIPAIRALYEAGGEDPILSLAAAAGAPTPLVKREAKRAEGSYWYSYGWPLAIGAIEVPLLEMVQAYGTIADNGIFKPMTTINSITDAKGNVVYAPPPVPPLIAITPSAAHQVSTILSDASLRPEGWNHAIDLPKDFTAGLKTGTSNLCFVRTFYGNCLSYGINNVWTLGFTDNLVVGVWVGNADNTAMQSKADGLTVAAPLWSAFVKNVRAQKGATASL